MGSRRAQCVFELLARSGRANALRRFPHADDVQGPFADCAVVAQFPCAGCAATAHDQRMGPVVGRSQLLYATGEPLHKLIPGPAPDYQPRSRSNTPTTTVSRWSDTRLHSRSPAIHRWIDGSRPNRQTPGYSISVAVRVVQSLKVQGPASTRGACGRR